MLASLEPPGASDLKIDAKAVAGKGLDLGLGATVADIAQNDPEETEEALDNPDTKDGLDNVELVELTGGAVNPDARKTKSSEQDMEVEEDLVEGVTDGASGLDEDDQEGDGTLLQVRKWTWSGLRRE